MMHAYATNCAWNVRLIAWLMVIATGIATAISWSTSHMNEWLGLSLGAPSAMIVFAGLFWLFDKHLWKWKWVRSTLLVPDLNGTWDCQGKTLTVQGKDDGGDWLATIRVVQSWTKIRIVLTRDGTSESVSLAASLYHEPARGYRLIYHYDNTPTDTERGLKQHCGVSDLLFDDQVSEANGRYFTDLNRMTAGTMKLTKRSA